MLKCPLCQSPEVKHYHHDGASNYGNCTVCDLVFVDEADLLAKPAEKSIYDHHENNPDDQGYRKHLSKLSTPLVEKLSAASIGLDFGSGPGPTLSKILEEQGMAMNIYDPFYAMDKAVLSPPQPYDFITMTEVIEHIYQPKTSLDQLWGILANGGWLAIMTGINQGPEFFKNWHYIKDPTHVRFYSVKTFSWLANTYGAELEFANENVIFLRKKI